MTRKLIYCDESGEASFSPKSEFKYFVVCAITIDESMKSKLQHRMREKQLKLYKLGWPKKIEIKASVLHNMKRDRRIPRSVKAAIDGDAFIQEILISLKNSCSPRVDYIAINKQRLMNESFRNTPYGIAYNYFAGKILVPLVHACADCVLTVDRRSKEMHSHKYFDGYIETMLFKKAIAEGVSMNSVIRHEESHMSYGLQAVDFFAWSIYRAKNNQDRRFIKIFDHLVENKEEWYC